MGIQDNRFLNGLAQGRHEHSKNSKLRQIFSDTTDCRLNRDTHCMGRGCF